MRSVNSKQESFADLDKTHLWHPFTQMRDWVRDDILVIEKGEGSYLFDTEGKRYIDGVSSLWCNVHGHRKKEIDEAIKAQLDRVAHSTFLGLSNVPAIELAEKLIAMAPQGLSRVFYSDSGSSAVEVALKMGYQYWQQAGNSADKKRSKYLHLSDSYHGDTLGSVSVGGIDLFHHVYQPFIFETIQVTAPYAYRRNAGLSEADYLAKCLQEMEAAVDRHHEELIGIIMEPVMLGAAGMLKQPKGYIRGIRDIANRRNLLLIFDEVATGFGRTGSMFAADTEGVTPDLMTVGKGITGGYLPLSATLTTEKIYEAFLGEYHEMKTFFHGHTYSGNPLAAAAGVANLTLFAQEKTLAALQPKIAFLEKKLATFNALDEVGDIRQAGFMVGIELVKDKKTREAYPWEEKRGIRVIEKARQRGVILRPLGSVVILMPPLSIEMPVLEELLDVTYWAIQETSA